MAGIEIHKEPDYGYRRSAPCDAVATALFVVGDPVALDTAQLRHAVDDDTEIEDGECVGFAAEPATGITAASRATNAADGFGVVENQDRTYWPVNAPGLQLRTRNFWGTGAPGTAVEPDAANIGDDYQLVGLNGLLTYGLEETASDNTTHIACCVQDVLDADMQPILRTGGTGVWVVFSVNAVSSQDVAGE